MEKENVSEQVLERALKAFWREVAKGYPERGTNEMEVGRAMALGSAGRQAVNSWLEFNAPSNLMARAEDKLRESLGALANGTFVEGRTDQPAARELAKGVLERGGTEEMASALRAIVVDREGKYKPSQATLMDSLEALNLYVQATREMPREMTEAEQSL